jgi:hypothetical protein
MAVQRQTLLSLVKDIAREMHSHIPSSVTDNQEATDIAHIIKETYYDMVALHKIPRSHKVIKLDASGDSAKPCLMTLPEDIEEIFSVNYDNKKVITDKVLMREVTYKSPTEFVDYVNGRDSTASNITIQVHNELSINVYSDQHPNCWTTFNDGSILFDGYFSTLDTTLQASKTQVFVHEADEFLIEDTYVPAVNLDSMRELKAEAKAMCFSIVKKEPNATAEINARRHRALGQGYRGVTERSASDRVDYGKR